MGGVPATAASDDADPFKWSGKSDPPAIGAKVKLLLQRLSDRTVTSVFCRVRLARQFRSILYPPAWYVKQNKGFGKAHFFGIDLEPRTAA